MPSILYAYTGRNHVGVPVPPPGTCAGGPGGNLPGVGLMFNPGWPALHHAQTVIGVYNMGAVSDAIEMAWRLSSFDLPTAENGAGIMTPSPIVAELDPTETAQLSYHVGTAAGVALALAGLNPGPGATYFPYHLRRYQNAGGIFTFAPGALLRPDLIFLSITVMLPPAPSVLNHFVIWECKGHAGAVGQMPLGPALQQSLAVVDLMTLAGLPFAMPFVGPVAPAAYVASQIDVFQPPPHPSPPQYRLQITDPGDPPRPGIELPEGPMNNFLRAYYTPFAQLLRSSPRRQRRTYDGTIFETLEIVPKIRFGLEASIYRSFVTESPTFTVDVGRALGAGFPNAAPDRVYVDRTGLSLELEDGWSPDARSSKRSA